MTLADSNIWDFLSQVDIMVPLIVVVTVLVISVTAIVAHHWRRAREAEYDAALKKMMLEQGKSAEEIERVIRVRGGMSEEADEDEDEDEE